MFRCANPKKKVKVISPHHQHVWTLATPDTSHLSNFATEFQKFLFSKHIQKQRSSGSILNTVMYSIAMYVRCSNACASKTFASHWACHHYITMYITLMRVHSRACASKVLSHSELVISHFITFSYNVHYLNLCSHFTLHHNVQKDCLTVSLSPATLSSNFS